MQNLESRHKNELTGHFRGQERELEQLWTTYDKDLEKLRSKLKQEADQKVKIIINHCTWSWMGEDQYKSGRANRTFSKAN